MNVALCHSSSDSSTITVAPLAQLPIQLVGGNPVYWRVAFTITLETQPRLVPLSPWPWTRPQPSPLVVEASVVAATLDQGSGSTLGHTSICLQGANCTFTFPEGKPITDIASWEELLLVDGRLRVRLEVRQPKP